MPIVLMESVSHRRRDPWLGRVVVAIILLIRLAAWVGRRPAPVRGHRGVPAAWLVGLVSLVVTSAYMRVSDVDALAWPSVAIYLALIVISVVGFGSGPVKGSPACHGGLLTYSWYWFVVAWRQVAPETVRERPIVDATISRDEFIDY